MGDHIATPYAPFRRHVECEVNRQSSVVGRTVRCDVGARPQTRDDDLAKPTLGHLDMVWCQFLEEFTRFREVFVGTGGLFVYGFVNKKHGP